MFPDKTRTVAINLTTMTQSDVDEAVDLVAASPSITLVVDMITLKQDLGQKAYNYLTSEGDLAHGTIKAATSLGRLVETIVVVDGPNSESDIRMWRSFGVQPTWPTYNCSAIVLTTCLTMKSITQSGAGGMVLFVTASDIYTDLLKHIIKSGKMLATILPNRGMISNAQRLSDVTLELENVLSQEDASVNLETYDYSGFIRLLNKLEGHLPFVGVQYFIERQLPKLGVRSRKTCYRIFHEAKARDILAISSRPNIDSNSKDVSACSLNRDHPLVRDVTNKFGTPREEEVDYEEDEPESEAVD